MGNAGKVLAIIGGIFSFLAIFLLTWVDSDIYIVYVSGIGGAMNIPDLFGTFGDILAAVLGMDGWIIYVILAVEVLLLLSWIFELIGAKVRFLAFLGGFFPFVIGLFLILGPLVSVDFLTKIFGIISYVGAQPDQLVTNIIPFNLGFADIALGAVIMTLGGLLGIISSFMKRDDLF